MRAKAFLPYELPEGPLQLDESLWSIQEAIKRPK